MTNPSTESTVSDRTIERMLLGELSDAESARVLRRLEEQGEAERLDDMIAAREAFLETHPPELVADEIRAKHRQRRRREDDAGQNQEHGGLAVIVPSSTAGRLALAAAVTLTLFAGAMFFLLGDEPRAVEPEPSSVVADGPSTDEPSNAAPGAARAPRQVAADDEAEEPLPSERVEFGDDDVLSPRESVRDGESGTRPGDGDDETFHVWGPKADRNHRGESDEDDDPEPVVADPNVDDIELLPPDERDAEAGKKAFVRANTELLKGNWAVAISKCEEGLAHGHRGCNRIIGIAYAKQSEYAKACHYLLKEGIDSYAELRCAEQPD